MRALLSNAGFPVPDSDTNYFENIYIVRDAFSHPISYVGAGPQSIQLLVPYSTNDFYHFRGNPYVNSNGLTRWSMPYGDTNNALDVLINYFNQIGIPTEGNFAPKEWIEPNQCAIYVNPKDFQ